MHIIEGRVLLDRPRPRVQERGVAHIVEHLAFNATEEFENHAIIKFLESIGAEFGACSNAYTTCEQLTAGFYATEHTAIKISAVISLHCSIVKAVRKTEPDGELDQMCSPSVACLYANINVLKPQDEGDVLLS